MTLNITCDMLPEQVLVEAHQAVGIPIIIILGTIMAVVSLLMIFFYKTKDGKGKYFGTWALTMLIILCFGIFFAYSPNVVQDIKEFVLSLFKVSQNFLPLLFINNVFEV